MFAQFLILTLAAIQSATLPDAPRQESITYISFVGFFENKCRYMTGDVGLDPKQFEEHLRNDFDFKNNIIIYHDAGVPQKCIQEARKVVEGVGFHSIRVQLAPEHLDMGPPN
ncbi:MAG: hypothetical protein ABIO86_08035 [Sphingomonas sp.]